MSKVKNPQEKKRLSYVRDRRNLFGENDKGSRKSIRKKKKRAHQRFRSAASSLKTLPHIGLDEERLLLAEQAVRDNEHLYQLKRFEKTPDVSLLDYIQCKQNRRKTRYGRRKPWIIAFTHSGLPSHSYWSLKQAQRLNYQKTPYSRCIHPLRNRK